MAQSTLYTCIYCSFFLATIVTETDTQVDNTNTKTAIIDNTIEISHNTTKTTTTSNIAIAKPSTISKKPSTSKMLDIIASGNNNAYGRGKRKKIEASYDEFVMDETE